MSDLFKAAAPDKAFTASENRYRELLKLHRPDTWGHFVQFYENDGFLTENIAYLAARTLNAGASSVLIATASHLSSIEGQLARYGFDLNRLREGGRYVALDAEETLARLMLDGWPDDDRFADIIDGVVRGAIEKSDSHFAFVFGEMVAVLCAANRPGAVVHLEQLWNSLTETYRFSLCCAYPLSNFVSEPGLEVVFQICAEHSLAIPAETGF